MPFKVIKDGATIPKQLGERTGKSRITGEKATIKDLRSYVYLADAVVQDEDIAPHIIEAYEDGDPHITSLIERIVEEEKVPSKPKRTKKSAPKEEVVAASEE